MKNKIKNLKKTKMICTLGPSSTDAKVIHKMIDLGMDCARLNCSHGDHKEKAEKIAIIRDYSESTAIMLDTKGPEIRTGEIALSEPDSCSGTTDETELMIGEEIRITTEDIKGDSKRISISYKKIADEIKPGQMIYLDDGLIALTVIAIDGKDIVCRIENGGVLGSRKTVAFPGLKISLEPITEQDVKDIMFAVKQNLDFIAVSFVKSANDILRVKDMVRQKGAKIMVIAKIETVESVANIDSILSVSDGIMVARGDLAVDIMPENVPMVQKDIAKRCNRAAKPVIIATQMLESMIKNPRPTRAEVNDIANAIIDGADAVMLSGETANGKYPTQALKQMITTALAVEHKHIFRAEQDTLIGVDDSIAAFIARAIHNASQTLKLDAVITPTSSGFTARLISRFRSEMTLIAITANLDTYRQLAITWGVYPMMGEFAAKSRQLVVDSINLAYSKGIVTRNDTIAVTAGVPAGQAGTTNLIEIHRVENFLAYSKSYNTSKNIE